MRLSIYQSNSGIDGILGRLNKLRQAVTNTDCDLMVCPELFVSGYNAPECFDDVDCKQISNFMQEAANLAAASKTALVLGYPEKDGQDLYNSAVFVDCDGHIIANHRKLAIPPGFEQDYFKASKSHTVFEYGGMKCAILICYDVEFPENIRALAQQGVQLVLVPTALNVNWPVVADHLIPTRAFESGVWIAYANHAGIENGLEYYGHSCIASPMGQEAARAGDEEQIITTEIDPALTVTAKKRLPYLQDLKNLP